ncbi:MAG: hypothetical protein JRI25_22940 [Deltaproteobacteria bacterium]|nr:hypothetical protein [Deltaproteobacteria bacterium]
MLEVAHPEDGPGEVRVEDLYVIDGRFEQNRTLDPRCLVVAIRIPPRKPGHRSTYRKVRARRAVDFPQLGLAVVGAFSGDGTCTDLTAVVSAVLPKPQRLKRMEAAVGTHLEDDVIEEIADGWRCAGRCRRCARPRSRMVPGSVTQSSVTASWERLRVEGTSSSAWGGPGRLPRLR